MSEFQIYLKKLANHCEKKQKFHLDDPRKKILVFSGVGLNWLGDYFANPKITWQIKKIPVEKIEFGGTSPEWNKILIDKCQRSVAKFKSLIKKNPKIYQQFKKKVIFNKEIIIVRLGDKKGYYKVLDGMHRFMEAVLSNKKSICAYVPVNETKYLPICEAHVVYDLIRGFERNANDKEGRQELYHALKLLSRTYANVKKLLINRFNKNYVHNAEIQKIIKKVLKD